MRTVWEQDGSEERVTAPLSLIVTAFAPVTDVRATLTPELRTRRGRHRAAAGRSRARAEPPGRLGAGAGATGSSATTPPDLDDPALLARLLRGRAGAERRGRAARLPRPLRRRPVRHAAGDGVRRRRAACDVDLAALRRRSAGGAVHRGAGRGAAGARGRRRARCARRSRARARRLRARARAAVAGGSRGRRARRRGAVDEERVPPCARVWSETTYAHAALRDDPTCADEEQAARTRRRRSRA